MASDFGLTTRPLSPSASLSSTGRCDAPRLERGPCACRPKAAASPASSESPGAEGTTTVRVCSCGSFMAWGSVTAGEYVKPARGAQRCEGDLLAALRLGGHSCERSPRLPPTATAEEFTTRCSVRGLLFRPVAERFVAQAEEHVLGHEG